MSRSSRLLDLIQLLRRHRRPVTAANLANELGVSERTLYRDIATLAAQGVPVQGEAGLGYVLQPGFLLPPLMFGDDEIDALALGLRWVASRGDGPLGRAAAHALAKITAVLPAGAHGAISNAGLLAGPGGNTALTDLSVLRCAIRKERKLDIVYADAQGRRTERKVWPVAIGFFDQVQVLAAWCEMRQGFRHFRTDRISYAELSDVRYPRHRCALLAEWRAQEGVPEQL